MTPLQLDRLALRCFAVMPFHDPPERAYPVVAEAARRASVEPVCGDVADGQPIADAAVGQELPLPLLPDSEL